MSKSTDAQQASPDVTRLKQELAAKTKQFSEKTSPAPQDRFSPNTSPYTNPSKENQTYKNNFEESLRKGTFAPSPDSSLKLAGESSLQEEIEKGAVDLEGFQEVAEAITDLIAKQGRKSVRAEEKLETNVTTPLCLKLISLCPGGIAELKAHLGLGDGAISKTALTLTPNAAILGLVEHILTNPENASVNNVESRPSSSIWSLPMNRLTSYDFTPESLSKQIDSISRDSIVAARESGQKGR
jgi:hypothetical protein